MRIGVPTEIKTDEFRVALTPAGVRELTAAGHEVFVEAGAGEGSAISDAEFEAQGASTLASAAEVFAAAEMIVKVKEPQPAEVELLEARHLLFTYLHLAAAPELTRGLIESGATCVAYETVTDASGALPLLAPMSEVAGKLATQAGAFMLQRPVAGRGALLGGVAGTTPSRVIVIGGGIVGLNAARIAIGMGAEVSVFDRSLDRLRELELFFGGSASTHYSTALEIERQLPEADLVVGAVLLTGARAPHVVSRAQLATMRRGAVLVDVAIDQGGCFETSRPTTHSEPAYEVDGIVHYCVANMPGDVGRTSTYGLTNTTLPYARIIAKNGWNKAVRENRGVATGANVVNGKITCKGVAEAFNLEYVPVEKVL